MRVAGGILVAVGLVMMLVSAGLTVLGMQHAYAQVQSADPQPSPAQFAGDLQTAIRYSLCYGAAGLLIVVAGLPLLIVGIVRGAGKRRNGAGPQHGE